MKSKMILLNPLISLLINLGPFLLQSEARDAEAEKLGKQIAEYVSKQIEIFESADEAEETILESDKFTNSMVPGENENYVVKRNYEVVLPENRLSLYWSVFSILVAPQVSFSVPSILALRISPQIELFFGRFMPPGHLPYVPRLRKVLSDASTPDDGESDEENSVLNGLE